MAELKVGDEAKAIRLLQEALEGRFDNKDVALSFEKWPVFSIRLVGRGYDSTITADIAEALIEVQNAVNR